MTHFDEQAQAYIHAPPVNLHSMLLAPATTTVGDQQCDQHNRDANEVAAAEQIEARRRLVMRFLPFIWLEDQNLDTATLMETVALRLSDAANAERLRRRMLLSQ